MFEVYRGERRYLAVDLVDALAEGDTLTGTPTVSVVEKRGRAPVADIVATPAPAIAGTEIRFWVEVPVDLERYRNLMVLVSSSTAAGEIAKEEALMLIL